MRGLFSFTRQVPGSNYAKQRMAETSGGLTSALHQEVFFGIKCTGINSMDEHQLEAFNAGRREGRIDSLEKAVGLLNDDVGKIKKALWMLYGAIALVQFLPEIKSLFAGSP